MVSILMPVFNAGPFLEACLNSILTQTYTTWELIAIDDHSTDNSRKILMDFAKKDSRIHTYSNVSKGIIPALRLAYQKSTGQLITRMDADDIMATEKLEALHQAAQRSGPGYVTCGWVAYFSDQPLGEGYKKYARWLNKNLGSPNPFSQIYKECVIPSPCWMVHRKDLDRCGAFASDTYPEDYDLCFRWYEIGMKIQEVKQLLHYWRDHEYRSSRTRPEYADNFFLSLKMHYFTKKEYCGEAIVLWGAGKKGKQIAEWLYNHGVTFQWICNTPTKWGKMIHQTALKPVSFLEKIENPLLVIAVANPGDQQQIRNFLEKLDLKEGQHYFFFC